MIFACSSASAQVRLVGVKGIQALLSNKEDVSSSEMVCNRNKCLFYSSKTVF
jgi:hypothetical protein